MIAGLMMISGMGLAGCSQGGATSGETGAPASTSVAPQAQPTTAAEVATGLGKIDQLGKDIAASAGTDKAKATSLDGQIEPTWKTIEDTVKQNDQNTYLTMEDNFAVLEKAAGDGDAAAATKGSAAITSAVQAYLTKYPG
jgi:hypothetical protein